MVVGLLLDINNVYVNACNHQFDPTEFISEISPSVVGEIHLAGHTVKNLPEGTIRIDTHDQRVCDDVWNLYEAVANRFNAAPTLIEWDKDLPEFSVLMDEANIARSYRWEIAKCNCVSCKVNLVLRFFAEKIQAYKHLLNSAVFKPHSESMFIGITYLQL